MRVSVIGCGHVGLVTGGCLAVIGHEVMCADINAEKIRGLQEGCIPIYEPHLEKMIQQSSAVGTLTFTDDSVQAARVSDVVFLCVGVPQSDDGQSDFSALDTAARQIAQAVDEPKLIVERSTVPVWTSKQLECLFAAYSRHRNARFSVAANPQFLREGTAVEDFLHPDRILLGVEDDGSERTLRQIYAPIFEQSFPCPIHPETCPRRRPPEPLVTNVRSAELIKHASNAFLGVKISYANVIADLCERLGANVDEVTHAVGLDPRIGRQFLKAGIGFGGYRLPKDLRTFCRLIEQESVDAGILQAAENVNRSRVDVFLEKAKHCLWVLNDKHIALLGLAHKAGTDDIRGSPAVELFKRLTAAGARVRAYDPRAMSNARLALPDLVLSRNAYEAAERADAIVIATEWDEFRLLDWQRIHNTMARPLVLDGRNLLSPATMKSLSFDYHSVGRPV